jgi:hypothetical protein
MLHTNYSGMLMFSPADIAAGSNAGSHDLYILTGDGKILKIISTKTEQFLQKDLQQALYDE